MHLQLPDVNTVLEQAFAAWASITNFHFRQIPTLADINIAFKDTNHSHFHPFRPEEYGHASFPPAGSVDFNEDWSRTNMSPSGQCTDSAPHALSVGSTILLAITKTSHLFEEIIIVCCEIPMKYENIMWTKFCYGKASPHNVFIFHRNLTTNNDYFLKQDRANELAVSTPSAVSSITSLSLAYKQIFETEHYHLGHGGVQFVRSALVFLLWLASSGLHGILSQKTEFFLIRICLYL
jgi:hypothetical protein